MLIINSHISRLTAAQIDFTSWGTLQGTCLGEALQKWHQNLNSNLSDSDSEDNGFSGPDGNGESGSDLDLDSENDDYEELCGVVPDSNSPPCCTAFLDTQILAFVGVTVKCSVYSL